MKPLYCVTARNRLTGTREIISSPMTREKAEEKKLELGAHRSATRPYTHPKVEVYVQHPKTSHVVTQKDLFDPNN